jgi:hypothetical protein
VRSSPAERYATAAVTSGSNVSSSASVQQVVDNDEAVRAERLDLFSRHHFAHRPAFSMNAINASL